MAVLCSLSSDQGVCCSLNQLKYVVLDYLLEEKSINYYKSKRTLQNLITYSRAILITYFCIFHSIRSIIHIIVGLGGCDNAGIVTKLVSVFFICYYYFRMNYYNSKEKFHLEFSNTFSPGSPIRPTSPY